jgi:hypothetical protein
VKFDEIVGVSLRGHPVFRADLMQRQKSELRSGCPMIRCIGCVMDAGSDLVIATADAEFRSSSWPKLKGDDESSPPIKPY